MGLFTRLLLALTAVVLVLSVACIGSTVSLHGDGFTVRNVRVVLDDGTEVVVSPPDALSAFFGGLGAGFSKLTWYAEPEYFPYYAIASENALDDGYIYVDISDLAAAGFYVEVYDSSDSLLDTVYPGDVNFKQYSVEAGHVYQFSPSDWTLTDQGEGVYFSYRRAVTITNNVDQDLTNYQVLIALDSSNFDFSKVRSDGADLRFTDADGNPLSYFVAWWEPSASRAYIVVKIPSIPASSSKTIYMLYGNPDVATSESDGYAVYDFFDDFEGDAIDTSKWEGEVDNFQVSDGVLKALADHSDLVAVGLSYSDVCVDAVIRTNSYGCGVGVRVGSNYDAKHPDGYYGAWRPAASVTSSRDNIRKYVGGDSTALANQGTSHPKNMWTFMYLKVHGNTIEAMITVDDPVLSASDTDLTEGSISVVCYSINGGEQNAEWDWVGVRQLVYPEPSISVGEEEEGSFFYSGSGGDSVSIEGLPSGYVARAGGSIKVSSGSPVSFDSISTVIIASTKQISFASPSSVYFKVYNSDGELLGTTDELSVDPGHAVCVFALAYYFDEFEELDSSYWDTQIADEGAFVGIDSDSGNPAPCAKIRVDDSGSPSPDSLIFQKPLPAEYQFSFDYSRGGTYSSPDLTVRFGNYRVELIQVDTNYDTVEESLRIRLQHYDGSSWNNVQSQTVGYTGAAWLHFTVSVSPSGISVTESVKGVSLSGEYIEEDVKGTLRFDEWHGSATDLIDNFEIVFGKQVSSYVVSADIEVQGEYVTARRSDDYSATGATCNLTVTVLDMLEGDEDYVERDSYLYSSLSLPASVGYSSPSISLRAPTSSGMKSVFIRIYVEAKGYDVIEGGLKSSSGYVDLQLTLYYAAQSAGKRVESAVLRLVDTNLSVETVYHPASVAAATLLAGCLLFAAWRLRCRSCE